MREKGKLNVIWPAEYHFQAPVVWKVDNAIHRINHYPLDRAIDFPKKSPLDIVIYPVDRAIQLLNNWGHRLQNSGFFFSKSVKKSVKRGVRVLRARSSRVSHAVLLVLQCYPRYRSPHVRESGFRNPSRFARGMENFACGIKNHGLWNLESH